MDKSAVAELSQALCQEGFLENTIGLEMLKDIDKELLFRSGQEFKTVYFDLEGFVEEACFLSVFEQFYSAMGSPKHVKDFTCKRIDGDRFCFSLKKRGKLLETKWEQADDWLSNEFIEFVLKVLKNRSGEFVQIKTDDQFVCFSYMGANAASLYADVEKNAEINLAFYYEKRVENNGCSLLIKLPDEDHRKIVKKFQELHGIKFDIESVENMPEAETINFQSKLQECDSYYMSLYKDHPLIYTGDANIGVEVWGRWASNNPDPYMVIMTHDLKNIYLCPPYNQGFPVADLNMPLG